ncbi:hypothetical protein KU735_23300, partial [Salmonella enterica subsp. enterica serovar Give]|nr:hypothetical protein [Salmonella enterica subsp. enterica serovar Give]
NNYKITRLFERAKGDVQVLQDASCYQLASVLTLAAEHRDTPEEQHARKPADSAKNQMRRQLTSIIRRNKSTTRSSILLSPTSS